MRAYTLNEDHDPSHGKPVSKGTLVYKLAGWDYGCAKDDTREFGIEYMAVTLDPAGGYPFVTVPVRFLDPIEAQP